MIDLDALVSLRAVAELGSVAAAAEARGFTPSAVSQQVKRLERQTGVRLLERAGRGVMLTHSGRHLAEQGGRLLTDLEQVESELRQQAGEVAGRVRLTTFSTAMRGLVAPVAGELTARHADLDLVLTEGEPWETVDLVSSGGTDLGLVHSWGDVPLSFPDHLVATPVATDLADVVVHRSHRLARRHQVTPADLVDEAWVATPEGTICRQWLTRMMLGSGRLPRFAHVAADFDSHLALVRAGLGIALVPRLGRSPLGDDLVALPAADPQPVRHVTALHRRSMAASPAVVAVVEALAAAGLDETAGAPARPGAQNSALASA